MGTVFANGRLILHKGDGLTQIAAAPDVCKTPSPGGPVPIPYPNLAQDSNLADGTKTVKVEKKSVALESSNLSTSTGDEAGTAGGGVVSSKTKGKLTWASVSIDVKFEGKGVARFLDPTLHNGNTSNTGGVSQGQPDTPPPPEQKCPPHNWEEVPPKQPDKEKRIQKLEISKEIGHRYNGCMARKLMKEGKDVDVGRQFKCLDCGLNQEIDLVVDGAPCECKAGNQSAGKGQTLRYRDISAKFFSGKGVKIFFREAATAANEAPHVAKWGAVAEHSPC